MLPHEWCQQRDRCWLNSLSGIATNEPPLFRIGQVVDIVWLDTETEPGLIRVDRGQILGMTRPLPGWLHQPGWWYFLHITHMDGQPFNRGYCVDEVHESELRAIP